MPEPRTEAGKRLVDWSESDALPLDCFVDGFTDASVRDLVLTIEAEAAAPRAATEPGLPALERALIEVRYWVEGMGAIDHTTGRRVTKADVLAVIDKALQ